ncbi:hypothetical protein HPP92_004806 [Vanilla planifolia]|uniref:Glycosyltransferase n=1 Tax=Vanilla planifolia TaxID=51239 RepID=A0A835RXE4_VANPL|nr:hypothetical protein HPP92_004806 [Vanilla planifolia]
MASDGQSPASCYFLGSQNENKWLRRPHFVLVPLMAPGHMIPMIDMAHLLADRAAAVVTIVTTPVNAARISDIIDAIAHSSLPIRFLSLTFPTAKFGLPDGCENADLLPSRDLAHNFLDACKALREPLEQHLQVCSPPPSCIVSDRFHAWTIDIALELHIPRLFFHGFGCIALLCVHVVREHQLLEQTDAIDDDKAFVLPDFPHRVELSRGQLPSFKTFFSARKYNDEMVAAEAASDGVMVNSFDEFEPGYREWCEKAIGKKVWTVGPVFLSNVSEEGTFGRGNKSSIDEDWCIKWLDSKKPGSVIYVSFGSLVQTGFTQLVEIGMGLEAADQPFIWVIKAGEQALEMEKWLTDGDGFEERMKGRGLIIRGWAPQATILGHPAVGGFMTHCGWNSTMEAVLAGMPMVTWPHFGDQFVNEKLIVEILKIGVAVGVNTVVGWRKAQETVVRSGDVEKAVRRLVDKGQWDGMKQRVQELSEKARRAMQPGGSSYCNLIDMVTTYSPVP